jgi:hypothetical protein
MNATNTREPHPISVASISPTPTDEEMAAVIAALTMAWPQPVVISAPVVPTATSPWKWSGRSWAQRRF